MSAQRSSDVKFDIGHVLFIDIVGYSKLLISLFWNNGEIEKMVDDKGLIQRFSACGDYFPLRSRRTLNAHKSLSGIGKVFSVPFDQDLRGNSAELSAGAAP
jgi:hypothetical protein